MKVNYLAGMDVSTSGLVAQRRSMDAAAENLANAQTTRTETGDPYRRKVAVMQADAESFRENLYGAAGSSVSSVSATARREADTARTGVAASIHEDPSDFPMVYDPGHPDADENGMVRMPNVETAREMVTLLAASRAYEANLAALQASRKVAESSLNLAR
jgi:flagellar basal-body rod protein FlgC